MDRKIYSVNERKRVCVCVREREREIERQREREGGLIWGIRILKEYTELDTAYSCSELITTNIFMYLYHKSIFLFIYLSI